MATWDDVVRIAKRYPEVEETIFYGTPSLKVRGRFFSRLRTESDGGLVLICTFEEKDALVQSDDPAFYTTPHHDGHASILIRLDLIETERLSEMIEESWLLRAPMRIRKEWEHNHATE